MSNTYRRPANRVSFKNPGVGRELKRHSAHQERGRTRELMTRGEFELASYEQRGKDKRFWIN